ncbi:hypothetical protein LTR99_000887 [Exophiala xenobiotica]|uniref:Uncharacterized protein n=1 Tax=Vermiconidia calcicola TaxID=1690605 RepID=A0AAV9QMU1_9PEZI|nr:hypothetical protein LTR96_003782 [Exophiala xenobiotica]KAK5307915.1 hypothetical protein LTR99_000887 [Exophiala xenobiotica]KAK5437413.1 hypothetical protein LTR34_000957 [Exophiala xenobiotica]KAK5545450.1 hypothetical protein LTR25_000457 [Vermiconidia calcicola]KAK5556216.1 hypothetical protein LTR46_006062 [Exophiala xenobiotica]
MTATAQNDVSHDPSLLFARNSDIPSTGEELRAAIASLKASTRATECRTRVLRRQSTLADRLKLLSNSSRNSMAGNARYFAQKEIAEVQHVKFALYGDMRTQLQAEVDSTVKSARSVQATAIEALNSDDRALAKLNDISARKPRNTLDVASIRDKASKMTTALHHFRSRSMKDRLDRVYLDSLDNFDAAKSSVDASGAVFEDAKSDLGSLYAEVDNVISMVMSQQFANLIEVALLNVQRLREREEQARNERTHDKLKSLTAVLENICNVLENLQSQRTTLHALSSDFDSTILMASSTRPKSTSEASQSCNLDAHPALFALMQHIGLADGNSNDLDDAIKRLVSELSQQADSNVLQILQLSQEAPKSSRAALQAISNALTTSSVRDSDVDDLERRIATARTQLDGLSPHAP